MSSSRRADEFLAELDADPEYQARRAALDEEHERLVQRNREDSAPVVRDLAEEGLVVEFVDDLYGQQLDYAHAIPVLLRWLPLIDNPDVKRGLIRALTVPWARPAAAHPLVRELWRVVKEAKPLIGERADVAWTIANALDEVADDSVVDDLLELVQGKYLDEDSRAMLLRALGNMHDPRASDCVLTVMQEQPQDRAVLVSGLIALGRMRSPGTRDIVLRYADHQDREVRQEARRAVKAIDGRPRGKA